MRSVHGDADDADNDDKIVVEPDEPAGSSVEPSARPTREQIRAKGTRQQMPLVRPPDTIRDPIEVLKNWPVSTEPHAPAVQPRATLRAPSPGPHLDDKIRLAHLALDLYRELEGTQRAPLHRGHAGDCQDPGCAAQANTLRGALVEACLLVQRIALAAPRQERDAVDDRLRELLALIDH